MGYVRDWTKIRNHITVTGREGIQAVCKDDASIREQLVRALLFHDESIATQEAAEAKAASLLAEMVQPREYTWE